MRYRLILFCGVACVLNQRVGPDNHPQMMKVFMRAGPSAGLRPGLCCNPYRLELNQERFCANENIRSVVFYFIPENEVSYALGCQKKSNPDKNNEKMRTERLCFHFTGLINPFILRLDMQLPLEPLSRKPVYRFPPATLICWLTLII